MKPEDFEKWVDKIRDEFYRCDASCDYSRFLQSIKDETATWDTGVQEDGSI
jgi:hypothetical protein